MQEDLEFSEILIVFHMLSVWMPVCRFPAVEPSKLMTKPVGKRITDLLSTPVFFDGGDSESPSGIALAL